MIDEIVSEDISRITDGVRSGALEHKRIFVAGGAGFIGSYLCDSFVRLGAKVTCLDNFSTGLDENVDHLSGRNNFRLVKGDVCEAEGEQKYDYILHLASRVSPEEYQLNPVKTLRANSCGSYRLLEMARKDNATILFASSSEIYGDASVFPTPEVYWGNVNTVGVRSCYDEGKRFGEALFMAFHREYDLDTRIVRIHNTYGPRLRADGYYGRALSRFILQALRNQNLTIYGDGTQTRSFCYVTDTVLGILLMLSTNGCEGKVVNIGSSFETPILNLAKKIREAAASKSSITYHPLPEDDPKRRLPDITKAKEIIGWEPKTSLDDGLTRTVNWFRKRA